MTRVDVINMYALRDWLADIARKCVLAFLRTYDKLNRPILNYFHGITAQNLMTTTWSILCGNVSSFRLLFAQQLIDILVYMICGYNARYLAAV